MSVPSCADRHFIIIHITLTYSFIQVSFERLSAVGALWRATRVPPKQGKARTHA